MLPCRVVVCTLATGRDNALYIHIRFGRDRTPLNAHAAIHDPHCVHNRGLGTGCDRFEQVLDDQKKSWWKRRRFMRHFFKPAPSPNLLLLMQPSYAIDYEKEC